MRTGDKDDYTRDIECHKFNFSFLLSLRTIPFREISSSMNREFAIRYWTKIALLLAEKKNSYFSVEVKKKLPWLLSLLERSKNFRFSTNDEEEAWIEPNGEGGRIPNEEQLISGICSIDY